MVVTAQVTVYFFKSLFFLDKDGSDHSQKSMMLMLILALAYTFSNTAFAYINYNMVARSSQIQELQQKENQKYKYMFDTLEDPIFLVKNGQIVFSNSLAKSLLESCPEAAVLNSLDIPLFFKMEHSADKTV